MQMRKDNPADYNYFYTICINQSEIFSDVSHSEWRYFGDLMHSMIEESQC
jgi:hypothetical protein